MWIKKQWDALPASWKYEIHSFIKTFISASLGVWAMQGFALPNSKEAFLGLIVAMFRVGVKAAWEVVFPSK